jgi:hypothetical protein
VFPYGVTGGVTHEHSVLDQPRLLAAAKGPDRGLDAVFLHIGATGQQQAAGGNDAYAITFAPLQKALPVGRLAFFHPGLAKLDRREKTSLI